MFLYERRFYLHNMYIWDDMDDLDLDSNNYDDLG